MSRQHVFKKVCPNNVQFTVRINSSLVKSDRILVKKHQRLPVPTRLHKFLSLRFHSFSQKTSSLIYIFIKKIQKQHNIKIDRITADFNRSRQHSIPSQSQKVADRPYYELVYMCRFGLSLMFRCFGRNTKSAFRSQTISKNNFFIIY